MTDVATGHMVLPGWFTIRGAVKPAEAVNLIFRIPRLVNGLRISLEETCDFSNGGKLLHRIIIEGCAGMTYAG